MPLRITNTTTDVAVLNRWAEDIETRLGTASKQAGHALTTIQNTPPVVIPPSVTDGLVHGNSIWWIDPAFTWFRDDFIGGSITDIGELRWALLGNPNQAAYTSGLSMMNLGEFQWANTATTNQVSYLTFSPTVSTLTRNRSWPLFDFPGWSATFIWRFHPASDSSGVAAAFTQKSMYVGFGFAAPEVDGQLTRPRTFIGARYDTDVTAPAISDATLKLEAVQNLSSPTNTRNNTQGTVVNTSITPTIDTYYRLDIKCIAAGVITMSINGAAPSSFNINTVTTTATIANGSTAQASAGLGRLSIAAADGYGPYGPGSSITVAGLGGGNAVLNGVHIVDDNSTSNETLFTFTSSSTIGSNTANYTITGYPSLIPIIMFGNDTQAAPTVDTKMSVDFFSFVWNKGIAGATTTTPTLNRYW